MRAPPARSRRRARCARGPSPACAAARARASPPCAGRSRRASPTRRPAAARARTPRPGRAASSASRSNSVGVRCTTSPASRTSRAAGSISSSPSRSDVAGRRRPPLHAPQQRAHPRDQLARRERLGHVVVGADRQPDQQVGLLAARRQHQHRDRPVALDAAADLEPVQPGQHQVEHHQVRAHAVAQRDAGVAVVRHLDREALGAQPRGDRGGDHLLVLDHADQRPGHAAQCVTARVRSGRRMLWRSCASLGA